MCEGAHNMKLWAPVGIELLRAGKIPGNFEFRLVHAVNRNGEERLFFCNGVDRSMCFTSFTRKETDPRINIPKSPAYC